MIEEIPYQGWARNLRLARDNRELVITLDVGPRILRYAFEGGPNLLKEFPEMLGATGESEWVVRGGHRLWTSPEGEHTYALDNSAVDYRQTGEDAIEIASPPCQEFGYQKTLGVAMEADGDVVVTHRLQNVSADQVLPYSIWALTVMAAGGAAIIPQPAFVPHPSDQPPGGPVNYDDFQPNRRLVTWAYTSLDDPRFAWNTAEWVVRQQPDTLSTKLGLLHRMGWVGYQLGEHVFCKSVACEEDMPYPDDGCNFELYTNSDMLELETLAPARPLQPGESATHIERWKLLPTGDDLTQPGAGAPFFAQLDSNNADA